MTKHNFQTGYRNIWDLRFGAYLEIELIRNF